MKTLNIAVIGIGDFGRLHIRVLQENPLSKVVAVCSRTPEKLKAICSEFDIPHWFTDVEELLQLPDLDGVVVATGEDTHYSYTKMAVEQGKHVLLEKPVCLDLVDGKALLDLAKESKVHILPGHILRHDAAYASAQAALANGAKGEIQSIRVKRNVPIERFSLHARTHPVFMALAHDIDILIWLTGSRAKRVTAMSRKTQPEFENPDILFGIAEMENGCLCSLETQWRLPNEYGQYLDTELEVMTSKGNLKLKCPGNGLSSMFDGVKHSYDLTLWPEIGGKLTGALATEIQHFLDLITGEAKEPVVSMEEAIKGIEMALMLIEASETGETVTQKF